MRLSSMLPVITGTTAYSSDHTRNGTNTRTKRRRKKVEASIVSGTSRNDEAITKSGTDCLKAPSISDTQRRPLSSVGIAPVSVQ